MHRTTRKANMMMRACLRCGGDLYRDMMEADEEYVCLQCGRRADKQTLFREEELGREARDVARVA